MQWLPMKPEPPVTRTVLMGRDSDGCRLIGPAPPACGALSTGGWRTASRMGL